MVIEWIVFAIFIFIGLPYLKFEHHSRKIKIAIILLLGFMLYFSIVNHFGSNKVDMNSPRGIINGIYLYVGWVGQTASNLWNIGTDTVTLVGNAIKFNETEEFSKK